jgi:paired amphipathic helix protein Sin3a
MLFKDAPDLLEEFKDFLPEILNPSSTTQSTTPWIQPDPLPDKSAKAGSRRKKRVAEKDPPQKAAPTRVCALSFVIPTTNFLLGCEESKV